MRKRESKEDEECEEELFWYFEFIVFTFFILVGCDEGVFLHYAHHSFSQPKFLSNFVIRFPSGTAQSWHLASGEGNARENGIPKSVCVIQKGALIVLWRKSIRAETHPKNALFPLDDYSHAFVFSLLRKRIFLFFKHKNKNKTPSAQQLLTYCFIQPITTELLTPALSPSLQYYIYF